MTPCETCHTAPAHDMPLIRALRLVGVNLAPIVCAACFDHLSREFVKEAMA